ncbi:MAG TPA: glycosyltransferase [Terracidiphilus sp.]
MLIQSVIAAARRWPKARITVLLPSDGPLRSELLPFVADVRVTNLGILRKSNLKKMRLRDAAKFLRKVMEARRVMQDYELIYINTAMVMDFILAACTVSKPRVIHVHEIPTGLAKPFFCALLIMTGAYVLFNSHATRASFIIPFWQKYSVVWNGVPPAKQLVVPEAHEKLNVLLIGRFNAWKGQSILLSAVRSLSVDLRSRLSVRLVGSVFGMQNHFAEDLSGTIAAQGLSSVVEMYPFNPNPGSHYLWADVVVVPSTKPEPFGLVAIEAMAAGRSVIAANHGGLSEIVIDGVTGTLFSPGSINSLASAIVSYIENPDRAQSEGAAGRERFEAEFEESHYKSKVTSVIAELTRSKLS